MGIEVRLRFYDTKKPILLKIDKFDMFFLDLCAFINRAKNISKRARDRNDNWQTTAGELANPSHQY